MRREWLFCCSVMLASVLPTVAAAQGPPVAGTHEFTHLQAAVAGKRTLVLHADGRQEEFARAWLDPDGILRRAADSTGVPLGALASIKVRQSSAVRGARIGAIVGGLSFLAIGISMAQDDFFDAGTGDVAVITLVGLGGGALTGALLGAPFNHWETVYRAPSALHPTLGFRDGRFRLGAGVSF